MKIPYLCLKDFIDIRTSPEVLAQKLTMAGLESKVPNPQNENCILEIDILPNRGDCLSVIGVAREIAALFNKKIKQFTYKLVEAKEKSSSRLKVEVRDKKLCPRYMARVIDGVVVKESPDWLKDRLVSAGMRPINNVVDITNYLLLSYGQPMHAFDADKISGQKLIVRKAAKGEKIVTLDGIEHQLAEDRLVIADNNGPVALAGVMGGVNSEVSLSTTSIILESAYFNPVSIHKTSKATKLRTEASIRFEKGTDWDMVAEALDRAAYIVAEIAGGMVLGGKIDIKNPGRKKHKITLRPAQIGNILGIDIPMKEIVKSLEGLGFKVAGKSDSKITVIVPTWREGDVLREIDLIEEIARIWGYDKIKTSLPLVREAAVEFVPEPQKQIREIMVACGLYEVQTFSLVDPKMAGEKAIVIQNPLTPEESVLRTGMMASLLKVISHNLRRQISNIKIFEIGKVFVPDEKLTLAGALSGGGVDYYAVKGVVENLLEEFSLDIKVEHLANRDFHPGKSAAVILGSRSFGIFGALHPDLLKVWDIKQEVYAFEFDLNVLLDYKIEPKKFNPLPKYPKIEQDLAMFVPQGVLSSALVETIKKAGGVMVEDVYLFDRFKDSQAYRIAFRDKYRTLKEEEVDRMFMDIQDELVKNHKVTIRKAA